MFGPLHLAAALRTVPRATVRGLSDTKMMLANPWLVIASMVLSTACGFASNDRVQSDLCSMFVVRIAPMSDPEVLCHLHGNTTPLMLLPGGVLADDSWSTLRQRLLTLERPISIRSATNGTTWFRFASREGTIEAGCIPQDTTEETCVWHLVAREFVSGPMAELQLYDLVDSVASTVAENATLHLIGGQRANGSQEQISLRIDGTAIREITWIDPHETKGVKPVWASGKR